MADRGPAPYRALIARAVPGYEPRHVEAWMRSEFGTLDHLSPARFDAEARLAARCCAEAGTDMCERLAQSHGL